MGDVMNERQPKDKTGDHENKRKQYFERCIEWLKDHLGALWENTKTHMNEPKFWLEVLALMVVSLYTVFSGCQVQVANKTLREVQSTNRPYIFTTPKFSFPQMPKPEDFINVPVTVTIYNLGVSPALKEIHSDPVIGLDTDPETIEHMQTCSVTYPKSEGVPLPPNQSSANASGITTMTITRHLSEDERKDVIINRTKRLVVFGGVKYSGLRGAEYETIYCYSWNPQSLNENSLPWSSCSCNKMK
jgi:hypothetical protein